MRASDTRSRSSPQAVFERGRDSLGRRALVHRYAPNRSEVISSSPALVLEGICGAGKTTLRTRLLEETRSRGLSPVEVIGPSVTYGPLVPFEDAGTLDDASNREHLGRLVDDFASRVSRGHRLILDTLHITQLVRPGCLSEESFLHIDARMRALGACLVFLRIPESTFVERVVEGRRDTEFEAYARKFGDSKSKVTRYFMQEQETMQKAIDDTGMPALTIDGSQPVESLAHDVLDFWTTRSRAVRSAPSEWQS